MVRDEYEGHQHCYLQCVAYAVETYSVKTKWTGTATVTIGVARDRWLFYTKAGAAWADDSYGLGVTGVSNLTIPATGFNITTTSVNKIIGGWTVGTGVKWAFADNWSARFEYDYLGLSSRTFAVPAGAPFLAGDTFTASGRNVQMATVGINYRFNWANPVVARY